jgi:hypothetical protein
MTKNWVVTTSGDRAIEDIEKRLAESGFAVDEVFGEIGSIIGSASDDVVERVRGLPGIADVSPQAPIDIGPPDAPVTW